MEGTWPVVRKVEREAAEAVEEETWLRWMRWAPSAGVVAVVAPLDEAVASREAVGGGPRCRDGGAHRCYPVRRRRRPH
eukprot:1752519-Prymnesium_polylepis.1